MGKAHLTETWRGQYDGVECELPSQSDIDHAFAEAKRLVANGDNVRAPKAYVVPRGQPNKQDGTRKQTY